MAMETRKMELEQEHERLIATKMELFEERFALVEMLIQHAVVCNGSITDDYFAVSPFLTYVCASPF